MSSGGLFLDRVARQHCPAPLHRHGQNNTHPLPSPTKPDISTLQRIGHFYFALTGAERDEGNRAIPARARCAAGTRRTGKDAGFTAPAEAGSPGKGKGSTNATIQEDIREAAERAELYTRFRERHNAINRLLSRYVFEPVLSWDLDTDVWLFSTVPKDMRGRPIQVSDGGTTVQVNEAAVVAALARLAANRKLEKARLCVWCRERWHVSEREIDKFCCAKCRQAYYAHSPEYRPKKAEAQRRYREQLKRHGLPNRERNNSTMPLCQPKRPKGTKSRIWWLDFHSDGQCIRRIHCAAPNSEDRVQPGDERTPPLAAPHWPTSCRWHPLRNNEAPRSQRARQEPNGFQWCRDPSGRGRRNLTLAEMTSGSAPATTKSRFGDSAVLRRLRRAARIPRR